MNSSRSSSNVNEPLYITSIKKTLSTIHSNESTKEININPFRRKRLASVSDVVQSLNKQRKNDVILKEEYLNFLINEKTNFADLDKVESHYKSQIITQYSTYNANKTILEEKAKEYNRITTQIETALVSRLDFSQNDFNLYYKKLIKETNKAIRLKEHELECYRNTYKRLYKSNYLLKKRYEEEMKIQNLNDEQHEKYNIIKNHAILTITNQNSMLNNMKLFYELSTMTY